MWAQGLARLVNLARHTAVQWFAAFALTSGGPFVR
jgi:hypothetical protein